MLLQPVIYNTLELSDRYPFTPYLTVPEFPSLPLLTTWDPEAQAATAESTRSYLGLDGTAHITPPRICWKLTLPYILLFLLSHRSGRFR